MSEESTDANLSQERRVLWQVLLLNAALSAGLAVAGLLGDSSGLLASALDNASDALVYALCLVAVGRPPRVKSLAAWASGVLLLLFAMAVLGDAARRAVTGSQPAGGVMAVMSVAAAGVNLLCLWLLRPVRTKDVNLRAAQTFSVNDFVSNVGILVAGGMVAWTGRVWPDLVVGIAVAGMATKGAVDIIRDARKTTGDTDGASTHTHTPES